MPPPPSLLAALRGQGAPESHLRRITALVEFAECDPTFLALFLVGSYARGNGDRVSDLDLVAIAEDGRAGAVLGKAHDLLARDDVLNKFTGTHEAHGRFWKLVYLDFSSVEFHVFEAATSFRLRHPHRVVWDPRGLLPAYVSDGEPVRHRDFAAYEYGDDGLIWELVDCIKWLSRGRHQLAKHHLAKLAAKLKTEDPDMPMHDLTHHPIHLGLGATATVEPAFTGAMDWYAGYEARHAKDGVEGRLVSMHSFTEPWGMWEMHPHGSEVVLCTHGRMTLQQQHPDGTTSSVVLGPGQYAVNEPGIWHTADIDGEATAVFITAGAGTQHRPR